MDGRADGVPRSLTDVDGALFFKIAPSGAISDTPLLIRRGSFRSLACIETAA